MAARRTPEELAAEHKRYFLAALGDGVTPEQALELTKHYIHAEALSEAMREQDFEPTDMPYPKPKKVE